MSFLDGIFRAPPEVEGGRGGGLAGITSAMPSNQEYVLDQDGVAHPIEPQKRVILGINAAPPKVSPRMVRVQTGQGEIVEVSASSVLMARVMQQLDGIVGPPPETLSGVVQVQMGDQVVEVPRAEYQKMLFRQKLHGIIGSPPETPPSRLMTGIKGGINRVASNTGGVIGQHVEQLVKGEIEQGIDVIFAWPGLNPPYGEDGTYQLPPGVATVPRGLPRGDGGESRAAKVAKGAGRVAWGVTKAVGKVGKMAGVGIAEGVTAWTAKQKQRQEDKKAAKRARATVVDATFNGGSDGGVVEGEVIEADFREV